jgi:hypothetical protein
MRKFWLGLLIAGLVAGLLAGCTTPFAAFPGEPRYYGVSVDLFFLEWGGPVATHRTADGGTTYLWFTGRNSAYIPGHDDSELIGNTAWWEGHPVRYLNLNKECGVEIVTNPDRTIREVLVFNSSVGWWQVPRCYAVFGPPQPVRP